MNAALGFAKTASARAKVRHWFRQQSREQALRAGEEVVHRELARVDLRSVPTAALARELGYESANDLYAAVGYGDRRPQSVVAAAWELVRGRHTDVAVRPPAPPLGAKSQSAAGLSLDGVDDILAKRGRCCNPVPGDDVVGFITRGRGVVIHRRDCIQLEDTREPERIVSIQWGAAAEQRHPVEIELDTRRNRNRLADLISQVTSVGAQVTSARATPQSEELERIHLTVACRDAAELTRVVERLERNPEVQSVHRPR
jgi:GTP pyrophosphokinase